MTNAKPLNKSGVTNAHNKCHWLPCSIDHDGLAPVSVYFRPELISKVDEPPTNAAAPAATTKSETCPSSLPVINPSASVQVYAASFRGRGLIAASNDRNNLPKNIIGSVMVPTTDTSTTSSLSNNDGEGYHINIQDHDHAEVTGMDHSKIVIMKEQFDRVLEWEHESDERKIINEYDNGGDKRMDECTGNEYGDYNTQTHSSVGRGLGILEILRSVNDPIPL